MELFEAGMRERLREQAPLAARMRPRRLEDVIGQEHLLGPDGPIARSLRAGKVNSMIFHGPPGTGKTTVARLIADHLHMAFAELSAVDSGVADVRRVLQQTERRLGEHGRRTLLFIDEIHRFSKSQQDALLHAVEDGLIVLVGATTENPHFEVISALLSRCQLYRFHPLGRSEIRVLIERALSGGYLDAGAARIEVDNDLKEAMCTLGGGDARRTLNLLEQSLLLAAERKATRLDRGTLETVAQQPLPLYDRAGDSHYNYASAFIKSLRASDPDAALYYLAVMLEGGEDPLFLARRMVIFASEDVGNADPRALEVAVAVARAVEFVGLPEARISLAQGVTYLSCCPKSNASYAALEKASRLVRQQGPLLPPLYLCDSRSAEVRASQSDEAYVYPHDYGGYSAQRCLPPALQGSVFYEPSVQGVEGRFREFLERMRSRREGGE